MVNTIFLGIAIVASAIFLIQFIMSIFSVTWIQIRISMQILVVPCHSKVLPIFVSASVGICILLKVHPYRLSWSVY